MMEPLGLRGPPRRAASDVYRPSLPADGGRKASLAPPRRRRLPIGASASKGSVLQGPGFFSAPAPSAPRISARGAVYGSRRWAGSGDGPVRGVDTRLLSASVRNTPEGSVQPSRARYEREALSAWTYQARA